MKGTIALVAASALLIVSTEWKTWVTGVPSASIHDPRESRWSVLQVKKLPMMVSAMMYALTEQRDSARCAGASVQLD